MATPRIIGSDEERDDNTSLSSNDDFSSNNSQVSLSRLMRSQVEIEDSEVSQFSVMKTLIN